MTAPDIEAALEVRDRLDCLTPRQREAVLLRADGYTYREIGCMMEISAPAAFYLVHRAKERMDGKSKQ